jgi:tellurite methyltransferase
MSDDTWARYYQAVQGREPRALFLAALAAFEADGFDTAGGQAVDLGCGDGTETMALLARGWCVLAVDREPAAIERVLAAVPDVAKPRLETQVASFEDVALPVADFIYAGLSLPFCPPEHFPCVKGGTRSEQGGNKCPFGVAPRRPLGMITRVGASDAANALCPRGRTADR